MEYLRNGYSATDAAIATNHHPDEANKLLKRGDICDAIDHAIHKKWDKTLEEYDVKWVLEQLIENHHLARQKGNITASNATLNTIAKLSLVDGFSPERVILSDDQKKAEVLARARQRFAKQKKEAFSKDPLDPLQLPEPDSKPPSPPLDFSNIE